MEMALTFLSGNVKGEYSCFSSFLACTKISAHKNIVRRDCDNDDECEGDLICFHRGDADVPNCLGTPGASDYCIKPVAGLLIERGNNGNPSANFPLGECEGDCDNDGDCAGDLVCFQRNGLESVPGCAGTVSSLGF